MMTETEANLKDFDAVLLTQVVVGPKAKSIETDTFKIQSTCTKSWLNCQKKPKDCLTRTATRST